VAANYKQALVREVYYNKGRHGSYGKRKFVRAPFLLVLFQPVDDVAWQEYWMPAPFGGAPSSTAGAGVMKDYMSSDNGDGECRHPFGYITRQDLTMDENQLGDWTPIGMAKPESEDTWMRFHRIGFI